LSTPAGLAEITRPSVLHVGCGGAPLPEWMGKCNETRLDADERCSPDVVATMTNMGDIGQFDIVFCSHALEHLSPSDVMKALAEFRRVLRPSGAVMVFVPDLEDVKPTFDPLYESPMGPISGHDMFYGHTLASETNPFMRHLTAFMSETLRGALTQAQFKNVRVDRIPPFNLFGVGTK
jgi:SAM-dependent methyltransferase